MTYRPCRRAAVVGEDVEKYCAAGSSGSEKIAIFESKNRLLHIIKGIMKKVDVVLGLQWGDEGKGM